MRKKKGLSALLAGTLVGASLGVLFAPKSGKETREDLKLKLDELANKVKNIDSHELKKEFKERIASLESDIKELDKEEVLARAKKEASSIKAKAEELVTLAKNKGNEALLNTAKELKEKAIATTKSVIAKLETDKDA